jgi:hypothetical protein
VRAARAICVLESMPVYEGRTMLAAGRMFLSVLVGIAAFYFVSWMPFSLIAFPGSWLIAIPVSIACAIAAGKYVWRATENAGAGGLLHRTLGGALTVGGVAFAAGFFGPMIFAPDANQGPLLGLLITGPLGFVLGGVGGFVWGCMHRRAV